MSPAGAETAARIALVAAAVYAAFGVPLGAFFAARGIDRLDPGARGARWTFRVLIFPAAALLWPLLLQRRLTGAVAPPRERNAHDRAAEDGAH